MSPELKEEMQARVDMQLDDQDCWEEGETRTQEEMEIYALECIVEMNRDYGGHFERGLVPDFKGSPAWVAEMKQKQREHSVEMEKARKAWLKMWNEAKRELAARTKSS